MSELNPVSRPGRADYAVAVVGGGPAGLAAAIAIAQTGAATALIARRLPYADNRTTALLGDSIGLLETLDVWRRCEDKAAALQVMRLVDDTGRLIRAPEVTFSSDEIGLDSFGFNIQNSVLLAAMEACAEQLPNLVRYDDEAELVTPGDDHVTVRLNDGRSLTAQLAVGADGRHSLCREAAGIAVNRRTLDQSAVTFNVTHTRPHRNTSTEFHTRYGPCVFVPLPDQRSSIVWVTTPTEAERLKGLDDNALGEAAERQSHSLLGKMRAEPGRHVFPLAIEQPQTLAAQRIVLVGEAAHVLPPIGAQGLNMGLRDAADLAAIVRETVTGNQDAGAPHVLSRYIRARRADVVSRTIAIDLANRSLLNDFLPAQSLRALGLHALGALGPIRRIAMREGLSPFWRSSGSLTERRLPRS